VSVLTAPASAGPDPASLKQALEHLLGGTCHHMFEVKTTDRMTVWGMARNLCPDANSVRMPNGRRWRSWQPARCSPRRRP